MEGDVCQKSEHWVQVRFSVWAEVCIQGESDRSLGFCCLLSGTYQGTTGKLIAEPLRHRN